MKRGAHIDAIDKQGLPSCYFILFLKGGLFFCHALSRRPLRSLALQAFNTTLLPPHSHPRARSCVPVLVRSILPLLWQSAVIGQTPET